MRKPRTNTLLLTTILVVAGLVGQAWLAGNPDPTRRDGSASGPVAGSALPHQNFLASAKVREEPVDASMPATLSAAMLPLPLSDDATVLVGEMCDLQLMADGTDLRLDSNQWKALAAAVLRFQSIRHTYEAQIATINVIAPGYYRAEIPMYAGAGDELRGQFFAELRTQLGEPTALAVMAALGDRLEKHFAGFGVSTQTLDITADPAERSNEIQVARTASYWNSVEGSERLTTRREIHFPVLEDPTGDSWSALLAKVGVTNAEDGPG